MLDAEVCITNKNYKFHPWRAAGEPMHKEVMTLPSSSHSGCSVFLKVWNQNFLENRDRFSVNLLTNNQFLVRHRWITDSKRLNACSTCPGASPLVTALVNLVPRKHSWYHWPHTSYHGWACQRPLPFPYFTLNFQSSQCQHRFGGSCSTTGCTIVFIPHIFLR